MRVAASLLFPLAPPMPDFLSYLAVNLIFLAIALCAHASLLQRVTGIYWDISLFKNLRCPLSSFRIERLPYCGKIGMYTYRQFLDSALY